MNPTVRRIAVSGLAWIAGAAAAVAVSLWALSSINADTASGPPQQLTPDSLTRAMPGPSAAASPDRPDQAPPGPSSGPPSARPTSAAGKKPSPTDDTVQRSLSSAGGTVVARCTGNSAYLVSWSPAQGYRAAHVERGPAAEVRVTFRSTTARIGTEVDVRCVAGIPTLDDD
ncbi:hypothetical protein [Dactylosporangium sp. CA-139066]|uniref:hypothetical protein n=1 Tax=Dactylosporangium sp. CA-139066 TaxID=3239930 RepID=UPI003D8DC57C